MFLMKNFQLFPAENVKIQQVEGRQSLNTQKSLRKFSEFSSTAWATTRRTWDGDGEVTQLLAHKTFSRSLFPLHLNSHKTIHLVKQASVKVSFDSYNYRCCLSLFYFITF